MDEVFASSAPDDEVLFELPVIKTWLRQLTLGITLIGHGSYRGVVELMRDLLGVRISEGTIHNVHQAAARQAGTINRGIDLSPIRVGLHDEIFQGSQSVLAGADAWSTYCYLLAPVTQKSPFLNHARATCLALFSSKPLLLDYNRLHQAVGGIPS